MTMTIFENFQKIANRNDYTIIGLQCNDLQISTVYGLEKIMI